MISYVSSSTKDLLVYLLARKWKQKLEQHAFINFRQLRYFSGSKFVSSLKERREVYFVKRILCLGLDESRVGGILEAAAVELSSEEL